MKRMIRRALFGVASVGLGLGFAFRPGYSDLALNGQVFGNVRAASASTVVTGSGTPGKLAKWTGLAGSNSVIGESTIFEDKNGNVGVGTQLPTSRFTVDGPVESARGGFKFPDGSIQSTSAAGALSAVTHNETLQGSGTPASPLGVATPLDVRDLDNPARQPIQVTAICEPLGVACAKTLYTVPAGKRLVVEYASVDAIVPAGQVVLVQIGSDFGLNGFRHSLPISPPATEIGGDPRTAVSQQVRIYADPGTDLKMSVTRPASGGNGFAQLSFTGYLVDLPSSALSGSQGVSGR